MTKNNITVVDAIMGAGKSSWAIQYINDHPELSFVYCCPLLTEIDRIKKSCPAAHFKEPTFEDNGRKIDNFNKLLMNGENIAVSHSCFINSTEETIEYIRNSDYVLILDETLSILEDYNNVCDPNMQLQKGDIRILFEKGFIKTDSYGNVSWVDDSYMDSQYADVERLAKNHTLLLLDNTILVWTFPYYIFSLFREVIVLTYLFEGSMLRPYFQYHGFQYEMKSVEQNDGKYVLVDHHDYAEKIARLRDLISIYDNTKANDYRNYALSKNWFQKARKEKEPMQRLKKHLATFFSKTAPFDTKRPSSEFKLWTAPKEYRNDLQGKGYICTAGLNKEENKLPEAERQRLRDQRSCFLSCNARATNEYKERYILAYVFNMYVNPYLGRYFENKNNTDGTDIHINEDLFALSNMLQWIFRSRIREEKPIYVYIPSMRMRKLFVRWLNGEIK